MFKMSEDEYEVYKAKVQQDRLIRQSVFGPMYKKNPTNEAFSKNDPVFKVACDKANHLPVTKRQASKFRNKKGAAYIAMKERVRVTC